MTTPIRMGLEIHQQLSTKKLFCNCPSIISEGEPDFIFTRKLRAVTGETGQVDIAAAHEMTKGKRFAYHGYWESCCLVDMDEQPPLPVNKEAVKIALTVAKLLHAKIVDEAQVMRKTVVDGSNVSGFQRTMAIGRDGWIETSEGKISIAGIYLEEEAAKPVSRSATEDVYNISRLGIPMLEIATGSEIKTPEGCKEAAHAIGLILRSVEGMKRGIGTIRQDVNVSIPGGARTEVKGFQDYKNIPLVIAREVERQKKLITEGKTLVPEVRKAEPDGSTTFLRPLPGEARMYPETDAIPVLLSEIEVSEEAIESIRERATRYEKIGMSKDLALLAAKSDNAGLIDEVIGECVDVKPSFVAETILALPRNLRRMGIEINSSNDDFRELFQSLQAGKISKEAVPDVLKAAAGKSVASVISQFKTMSQAELDSELKKVIASSQGQSPGAIMGKAMAVLRGKVSGEIVAKRLKELMS